MTIPRREVWSGTSPSEKPYSFTLEPYCVSDKKAQRIRTKRILCASVVQALRRR